MLRFFRSSNHLVIVTILLFGVMIWLHALIGSESKAWFGLFLFLSTAFLLVYVNSLLHLVEKISYLPALCYVLFVGGAPEIHRFNPSVIAAILLVAVFFLLSKSFESERLSYHFFTVSALISFSTFFYRYMYAYMLAVWLVIALLRPGYWREWVFSILGYAIPLFFAFSWFFLINDDPDRMGFFLKEIFTCQWVLPTMSTTTIIFFPSCILLIITLFKNMLQNIGSKKVILRNRYYVLMMILGVTAGMILVVPDVLPHAWYLLAFPMSFFISNYLSATKSIRWGTIVLSLLLVGVIAAQSFFFLSKE